MADTRCRRCGGPPPRHSLAGGVRSGPGSGCGSVTGSSGHTRCVGDDGPAGRSTGAPGRRRRRGRSGRRSDGRSVSLCLRLSRSGRRYRARALCRAGGAGRTGGGRCCGSSLGGFAAVCGFLGTAGGQTGRARSAVTLGTGLGRYPRGRSAASGTGPGRMGVCGRWPGSSHRCDRRSGATGSGLRLIRHHRRRLRRGGNCGGCLGRREAELGPALAVAGVPGAAGPGAGTDRARIGGGRQERACGGHSGLPISDMTRDT